MILKVPSRLHSLHSRSEWEWIEVLQQWTVGEIMILFNNELFRVDPQNIRMSMKWDCSVFSSKKTETVLVFIKLLLCKKIHHINIKTEIKQHSHINTKHSTEMPWACTFYFLPLYSSHLLSTLCVPAASAHQRLLLVPPPWDPLHGGQRGEKETLAQGGWAEIRSPTTISTKKHLSLHLSFALQACHLHPAWHITCPAH